MSSHEISTGNSSAIRQIVIDTGLDDGKGIGAIEPLEGGVSSDIAVVTLPDGKVCVKRALAKLKVEADWRVPVERNAAEYRWYEAAAAIVPGCVPQLYGHSASAQGFVMAYLPPSTHKNWKSELMAGVVDPSFAGQVGAALGKIHRATASDKSIAERFANADDFHAIRIEPYLCFTATLNPDIADTLVALAEEQHRTRIALVHGDISPKNILAGPHGPVFLDAECANHGDPAFDVAFCLNHLLLKMIIRPSCVALLRQSARNLCDAHRRSVAWEDPRDFDRRTARLLPGLMLGRVDGKSPVEYFDTHQRTRVRQIARDWLQNPPSGCTALINAMAGLAA